MPAGKRRTLISGSNSASRHNRKRFFSDFQPIEERMALGSRFDGSAHNAGYFGGERSSLFGGDQGRRNARQCSGTGRHGCCLIAGSRHRSSILDDYPHSSKGREVRDGLIPPIEISAPTLESVGAAAFRCPKSSSGIMAIRIRNRHSHPRSEDGDDRHVRHQADCPAR